MSKLNYYPKQIIKSIDRCTKCTNHFIKSVNANHSMNADYNKYKRIADVLFIIALIIFVILFIGAAIIIIHH